MNPNESTYSPLAFADEEIARIINLCASAREMPNQLFVIEQDVAIVFAGF